MSNGDARRFPHFYLPGHGDRETYTSPVSGGGSMPLPKRDRATHAAKLRHDLSIAIQQARAQAAQRYPEVAAGAKGFYLAFEIPTAQAAIVDKLENKQGNKPIELVAVRPAPDDPNNHVLATVYVPSERANHYERKVDAYEHEDQVRHKKGPDKQYLTDSAGNRIEKSRRPKHEDLVASIDAIRLAPLKALFTDPGDFPALGQDVWWEIWLKRDTDQAAIHAATHLGITVRAHTVRFPEREVVLARTTPEALSRLMTQTDAIAELRLNRDTPALFMELEPTAQIEWTNDLLSRLEPPPGHVPAVCVLDSGMTRRHPLIEPALATSWLPSFYTWIYLVTLLHFMHSFCSQRRVFRPQLPSNLARGSSNPCRRPATQDRPVTH